jgi:excisionase family DNA binding protein
MTRKTTEPNVDRYLLPSQAAAILHVSPKTIARWAKEGRIPSTRTLGGHRRFNEQELRALEASMRVQVRQP